MKISLIVPCYNEEQTLRILYDNVRSVAERLEPYLFEFLFVDDGSSDRTLEILKELAGKDPRVIYISFSRNFGKEAAMYAGLRNCTGDYAAVMDADMQDPPELLPEMLRILETGEYDCVAARRVSRKGEPLLRSFCARMFYRVINRISDVDIVDGARDYRLMKRCVVNAVVSMGEYNRFSKGIFGWVGFKTYWLSYENVERAAGETKWSFWKLLKYSVEGIVDFSQAPLRLASCLGIGLTAVSFVFIFLIMVRKLIYGDPVAGWPSTICVIMFIGGMQFFCMGIMGQYLAKTYLEVKRRPQYIIAETNRATAENGLFPGN